MILAATRWAARRSRSARAAVALLPLRRAVAPVARHAGALLSTSRYKLARLPLLHGVAPDLADVVGLLDPLAIYPATLLLGLGSLTAAEVEPASPRWRPLRALRARGPRRLGRELAARHDARDPRGQRSSSASPSASTPASSSERSARGAAWSSALLGPLFLVSGLSTGAALMMLSPLGHAEHAAARRWDLAAIGLEIGAARSCSCSALVSGADRGRAGRGRALPRRPLHRAPSGRWS